MTEPTTDDDRHYTSGQVDITCNPKRCIHAEYCVKHLTGAFDKQKRPRIHPEAAPLEVIAAVIELCPSGALHYDRKDGLKEAASSRNMIVVLHNGSLEILGDLAITGMKVTLQEEIRATLCRCGGSISWATSSSLT